MPLSGARVSIYFAGGDTRVGLGLACGPCSLRAIRARHGRTPERLLYVVFPTNKKRTQTPPRIQEIARVRFPCLCLQCGVAELDQLGHG